VKLFSSRDLSIHPFVPSSIHGWHHTGNKTLAEINNPPPLHMCRYLGKACPAPGGAPPRFWYQYQQQTQQDFQRPGSPWIHATCGFGNVVCNCNFVICTIKYTHLCIRHRVQTIHKIRGLGEAKAESGLTFWECPPPMGFIYHKALDKIYHEPNLHRS